MASTIHSLVPAEVGWRAFYRGEYEEDGESARVVAWALVDGADGREVVGLVVDAGDPTKIVPAPDGASALAPDFDRYGFRGD
ncbi:MAG: hypothetical protein OEW31_07610 [Thermoleophilia bacterium]|nr:hypothetical protein [Thermoleophilia bacterium]MDH4346184.1 hypothetical protein [Thermoleophilia bacterium]MDH5333973.1 hypothetical protein [Thermoleophilia bacterium]